jgi:hypothetical protein
MDVIGFLYVSLCRSTVHHHDILGSRRACASSVAGFSSQNGDRASGVYYRRAVFSCACFCGQNDSLKRIFVKKMFPVYGGKCLSRKAVHNWAEEFSQGRSKVIDDETEVRKWLRQRSKDFYSARFEALVKRWDKCISAGGGYVEKHFFSPQIRMPHVLRFRSICDLFTDSPSY